MQYQKANVTGTIRGPNVTRALNEKLLALWATPQDNGAMVPTSTMKYQVLELYMWLVYILYRNASYVNVQ